MIINAIIPARMGSSRFPGKPLAKILNLPMIEHVRRRTLLSPTINNVYVATPDQEIFDTIESYGGNAILTGEHERCTDRVEETSHTVKSDIIVIIQGDEPLLIPNLIEKLVLPMSDTIQCTNLLSIIHNPKSIPDQDIVKTVIDINENVLYYSRAPIPYPMTKSKITHYRQTGMSAFTPEFLQTYTSLPPTPLEIVESVDFLRILEHGHRIRGVITDVETVGVDRKNDIRKCENILKNNDAQARYFAAMNQEFEV